LTNSQHQMAQSQRHFYFHADIVLDSQGVSSYHSPSFLPMKLLAIVSMQR